MEHRVLWATCLFVALAVWSSNEAFAGAAGDWKSYYLPLVIF